MANRIKKNKAKNALSLAMPFSLGMTGQIQEILESRGEELGKFVILQARKERKHVVQ